MDVGIYAEMCPVHGTPKTKKVRKRCEVDSDDLIGRFLNVLIDHAEKTFRESARDDRKFAGRCRAPWTLPTLMKATREELNLVPEGASSAAHGADVTRRLLSSLANGSQGPAELRGLHGTANGQHGSASGLTARHARLAVGAASTLAEFLFETHEATNRPR